MIIVDSKSFIKDGGIGVLVMIATLIYRIEIPAVTAGRSDARTIRFVEEADTIFTSWFVKFCQCSAKL